MKQPFLAYNKNLKDYSRILRNNSTPGEIALWKKLRAGQLYGYKFNRQKPIGNYIVDFYCKSMHLVIEIDGYCHQFKAKKDRIRDDRLAKLDLTIFRFPEEQVMDDMNNVMLAIEVWM